MASKRQVEEAAAALDGVTLEFSHNEVVASAPDGYCFRYHGKGAHSLVGSRDDLLREPMSAVYSDMVDRLKWGIEPCDCGDNCGESVTNGNTLPHKA